MKQVTYDGEVRANARHKRPEGFSRDFGRREG